MNVKMNENSKKTDQHAQLALCRAGRSLLIYFVVDIFKKGALADMCGTLINCKQ